MLVSQANRSPSRVEAVSLNCCDDSKPPPRRFLFIFCGAEWLHSLNLRSYFRAPVKISNFRCMAIRIKFPCPTCKGTDLRLSRSGSKAANMIAAFFFLKAVRCRECGARHYFPAFVPEKRALQEQQWEPAKSGLPHGTRLVWLEDLAFTLGTRRTLSLRFRRCHLQNPAILP